MLSIEGVLILKSFFQWYRNTENLENKRIRDDANYQDKQLVAVGNAIHSLIPEFDNLRIRRSPPRMTVNKTIGDKVEEFWWGDKLARK